MIAPSPAMLKMLKNAEAGRDWYFSLSGRSSHGGAHKTLAALKSRGWIDDVGSFRITESGRTALQKYAHSAGSKP